MHSAAVIQQQRNVGALWHGWAENGSESVLLLDFFNQFSFKETIERQETIGGEIFKRGWWTTGWKELHYSHRDKGFYSKYSRDKWAPRAQKLVWSYVLGHWKHCNVMVNRENEEQERLIERKRLEQRVREVYSKRLSVGKRQNLYHRTIEDILTKTSHHLINWLKDVDTAIKVEKRQQERKREGKTRFGGS